VSSWQEISRESLVAAKSLSQDSRWRSAVSRAYYAAYASVSGALDGLAEFPKDRRGPSHDLLPVLVMTYLTRIGFFDRRKVAAASRRLYRYRISADYEPPTLIDRAFAGMALRDASFIVRTIADAKR
jgi:uncharacterized protein (UPF0332 family)